MRKWLVWVMAAALTAPLSGCYTMRHAVEDSINPVEFSHSEGDRRYHFAEDGRSYFLFYGLLAIYQVKTDQLLEKHGRKGTQVTNLKVEQELGPMDIALTIGINVLGGAFTGGLVPLLGISSRTVHCEGDVVNANEEAAE